MSRDQKERSAELRARLKKNASESGDVRHSLILPEGVSAWRPTKAGVYEIDIMPYTVSDANHPDNLSVVGKEWHRRPYFSHRIGNRNIVCPISVGKPCPICEEIARLFKDGYERNKAQIKAIGRKVQCLYNVIVLSEREKGIQVFDWSSYKFAEAFEKRLDRGEEDDLGFLELGDDARTIKFWTEEKTFPLAEGGLSKPFIQADQIDFIPRKKKYDESILEKVVDLDKCLEIKPFEVIEKLFLDMGEVSESKKEKKQEKNEDDDPGFDDDKKPPIEKSTKNPVNVEKEESLPNPDTMDEDDILEYIKEHIDDFEEVKSMKELAKMDEDDLQDYLKELLAQKSHEAPQRNTSEKEESLPNPDTMDEDDILEYIKEHIDDFEEVKSMKELAKMDEDDLQDYLKELLAQKKEKTPNNNGEGEIVVTKESLEEMTKSDIVDFLLENKKDLGVKKTATELRRMAVDELRKYAGKLL